MAQELATKTGDSARGESMLDGLAVLSRYVFRGGLAGVICGILFYGLGGRLVMRLSALLNSEKRGVLTENGNVIGEITLEGTLELLFFTGIFGGIIAGFVWVVIREWLPARLPARAVVAALAAASIGSFGMLTEDNVDFRILSPAWLHFLMFLGLTGLSGAAIAYADPRLEHVLPSGRLPALGYALLVLSIGGMTVGTLLIVALTTGSLLTLVAVSLLALLALDLVVWRGRYLGSAGPSWLGVPAVAVILIACVAALVHFGIEAEKVLSGSV